MPKAKRLVHPHKQTHCLDQPVLASGQATGKRTFDERADDRQPSPDHQPQADGEEDDPAFEVSGGEMAPPTAVNRRLEAVAFKVPECNRLGNCDLVDMIAKAIAKLPDKARE